LTLQLLHSTNFNTHLETVILNLKTYLDPAVPRGDLSRRLEAFFETWGTHYVDSCAVGGAIILEMVTERDDPILTNVAKALEELVTIGNTDKLEQQLKQSKKWDLKSFGGTVIHCSTMKEVCNTNFQDWKDSVKKKPVPLPTTFKFKDFTAFFPSTRARQEEYSTILQPTTGEQKKVNVEIVKMNEKVKGLYKEALQKKLDGGGMSGCVIL